MNVLLDTCTFLWLAAEEGRLSNTAVRLFADPVNGFKDMPLTTLEWYCPGVGLVKVERVEPANSTFLIGGTMTMELMAWE